MIKKKTETAKRATWGEMLTKEELLALLDRLDQKKLERKQMSEEKKFKNPFIAAAMAAKAAAANPKVPGAKTSQVQAAKHGNQVTTNKPAKKSAGRGR